MAPYKYLTPDYESGTQCRSFNIPLPLLAAWNGAIGDMFDPDNWEQVGDMTPEECAQAMLECWENGEDC